MTVTGNVNSNGRSVGLFLPVGLGILSAATAAGLLQVSSLRWMLVAIGGLAALVPAVALENPRLYGLAVFLFMLMIEGHTGKNLTKGIMDVDNLMEDLGIPPAKTVGLVVRPSDIILACLLIAWLLRIATRKERVSIPWQAYFAFAYLGVATLSVVLKAQYVDLGLVELVQQIKYVVMFLYFAHAVRTSTVAKKLIAVLVICLFVEASISLIGLKSARARNLLSFLSPSSAAEVEKQLPAFEEDPSGGQRGVGTFQDVTVTAMYLHFVLPLALGLVVTARNPLKKLVYLSLFALGGAALWTTYSRTGLVAAGCGFVCWLFLSSRRRLVTPQHALLILYSALVVGTAASPLIVRYLKSRPSNFENRFPILREAYDLIKTNPVLGVGLNNSTAVRKHSLIRPLEQELLGIDSQPIHNHYVTVASETGPIGLVLFVGFFVVIVREAIRQTRGPDKQLACFAIAIVSAYVAMSLQLVFDTIGGYVVCEMLYLYAGLAVALSRLPRSNPAEAVFSH